METVLYISISTIAISTSLYLLSIALDRFQETVERFLAICVPTIADFIDKIRHPDNYQD